MASAAVIDIEQLLQPIAGDNPCGENLRWEVVYDEIRQARNRSDRDALVESEDAANWPRVVELCNTALSARSKDLLIAAWLTEGLLHLHGFAGLRDGVRLICGLIERFWDHLYPEQDEEDLEPRVAPLNWLTAADSGSLLPNAIRALPLVTQAPGEDGLGVVSWSFWKSCYPPPKSESEDESAYASRKGEAARRKEFFEEQMGKASTEHFQNLSEDLSEALQAVSEFDRLVDARFGDLAPGTTAIRQACEDCAALIRSRLPEAEPLAAPGAVSAEAAAGDGEEAAISGVSGPIRSREDAFRRLEEIASYLRQTDPHSPVSYLVHRAVNWSQMPFDDLLKELVKEDDARRRICELLGIKQEEESY